MSTVYPLRFADQLRQHLKGLRKKRGLTQARLGQLLGVSQARIAEIEANPGLVNLDQLLQVFSALGATLSLEEADTETTETDRPPPQQRTKNAKADQPADNRATQAVETKPHEDARSTPSQLKQGRPDKDGKSTPTRNFLIRPKKGSW